MKTKRRKFGDWGESIACKLLVKNGFGIVERNFLRPCGEIDIVASRNNISYFVEVKTVTRKTKSYDQKNFGSYIPEDNIGYLKVYRMRKIIAVYIKEKMLKNDWKFMVISISVEKLSNGKASIKYNVFYDVL